MASEASSPNGMPPLSAKTVGTRSANESPALSTMRNDSLALRSPDLEPLKLPSATAKSSGKAGDKDLGSGSGSGTSPLMGSAAPLSPSRAFMSPRAGSVGGWGEATQTNNSLFAQAAGNNSFFQGTITRDMKEEHGQYSQGIFLAAEGSSADRLQALSTLTLLLRKRLGDVDACQIPIANATCFALCDVVALRCADTSQKVQATALDLVPLLFRSVHSSVVDATSPRWVSCLSTALASSYQAVQNAAAAAFGSLLQHSSEQNLRNLCQTICMTCATVRNVNTKIELMSALGTLVRRHHVILAREGASGDQSPMASSVVRIGLGRSDLEFSTETALRIWCGDSREEVRRVAGQLLIALLDCAWDGEEGRILDNKRLDADNWGLIKALFDRHREQQASSAA